jgi:ribose transport system permease protein
MDVSIAPKKMTTRSVLRSDATRKFLAFGALIVLLVYFSLASPHFMTFNNVVGILLQTSVNGVLALGVTFVIITGGIDLSIGTVMTFSSVISAIVCINWGLPVWAGVLGGMGAGALAGFVNGTIISRMKVPPFITTLGIMYIAKGLSLVLSELRPIYFNAAPGFRNIAMGSLVEKIIPGAEIPNAVLIMFGAAIFAAFLLNRTILGRYTFALGSNEEATRLSGVNVNFWKTMVYTVCGLFSGIAGVLMASRLNSAQPALGQGYELDAIAAVVIGGTSLSGGEGTILGTIIGAFVMSVLVNGLRIMSIEQEWQIVITGGILVAAVYMDVIRRRAIA